MEIMRVGAEQAEVKAEEVIRELKAIGFSDIRKVVSWRNELVTQQLEEGEGGEPKTMLMPRVSIIDADKIDGEAAKAVAEVSQQANGALRVKLHDKHAALVSIGRHLGMFTDTVKIDVVYGISEEPMSAEEWKKQFAGDGWSACAGAGGRERARNTRSSCARSRRFSSAALVAAARPTLEDGVQLMTPIIRCPRTGRGCSDVICRDRSWCEPSAVILFILIASS